MGQAMFYHLTRNPMEVALADLLGRAHARGMRVAVRGVDAKRLEWLDEKLWLGPEEQFLPHGLAGGPQDARQPILLTTSTDIPNGATCVMAIDGAEVTVEDVAGHDRVCVLFDGNDEAMLNGARGQWKMLKDAGAKAQYWSEESGRWEMKAET
jgi:DNA polymerase-3 subunit chi